MKSALVGIGGVQTVARGECYPKAPPPFPEAKTIRQGSLITLTNLIGTANANFVPTEEKVPFYVVPLAISGLLVGLASFDPSFVKVTAIATVCFLSFYYAYMHRKASPDTIYFSPRFSAIYPPIQYEASFDERVQESPRDSLLVSKLDMAFREYRLHVFDAARLEERISGLERECREASVSDEPSLARAEALFTSLLPPSAEYENVVVVIGGSGVGKSTAINYLCARQMVAVNPLFLRKEPSEEDDKLVIAENSVAEIGHRVGVNSSQTLVPQFIPNKDSEIVYCDFPGFDENRGFDVAICAKWLADDALNRAKSLRGFLFLLDYNDLMSRKGLNAIEDFQYLHQLLKYFSEKSVLFLMMNAPRSTSLSRVKEKLRDIIQSNQQDPFYRAILEKKALDTHLVVCDPCSSWITRTWLTRKIKDLQPIACRTNMYYPLSPSVLRRIDEIRLGLEKEIEETLFLLQKGLNVHWGKKIIASTRAQDLREVYRALRTLQESLRDNLERLVNQSSSICPELSAVLQQKRHEWDKCARLPPFHLAFSPFWKPLGIAFAQNFESLIDQTKKDYYAKTSDPIDREPDVGCEIL